MPSFLFWILAALTLIGAIAVIAFKNPVSSAMSMVASFVGLAGLFIGLSAFFVGIIQILVYTGAVMVLFVFIIMLLDLNAEEKGKRPWYPWVAGAVLIVAFLIQLIGVLSANPDSSTPMDKLAVQNAVFPTENVTIQSALAAGKLPDLHLIGNLLFTEYNFPLQIVGVLLLVATVGVIVLSKRQTN